MPKDYACAERLLGIADVVWTNFVQGKKILERRSACVTCNSCTCYTHPGFVKVREKSSYVSKTADNNSLACH